MSQLKFEDEEFEKAFLAGDIPVCCPITVRATENGTEITTLKLTENIARELAECDNPFSSEIVDSVFEKLSSVVSEYGYELDREMSTPIAEFTLDSSDNLPEFFPEEAVCVLRPELDEGDFDILAESECEFADIPENEECAVVLIENEVVALCTVNDYSDGDDVEINIEVHPDYRGRGYGKATVCELCQSLIMKGETVSYKTYEGNIPSVLLARSLGFCERARTLSFVGYLTEE